MKYLKKYENWEDEASKMGLCLCRGSVTIDTAHTSPPEADVLLLAFEFMAGAVMTIGKTLVLRKYSHS